MDGVSIESWGPSALIVRFADSPSPASLERCRGLLAALDTLGLPPGTEILPGYSEILVDLPESLPLAEGRRLVAETIAQAEAISADGAPLHRISLVYDGPDLAEFAERVGLTIPEIAEIHSAAIYDVFLIGFAPGFTYLGPLDPRLHLARKDTPRPRVEAGSVGIGGSHTGIYSIASPGGWWLLGHTTTTLFDPTRNDARAFRFSLGDRVKFDPMT